MARWQKPARLGIGVFGIVCAIVVYAAIGERETAVPLARPSRLDPRAIIESAGAAFQQFRNVRKDFVIEAEQQLTYEGGDTRFIGVTITVRNRGGRDFVVSGREARAAEDNEELQVTGSVKLVASDGFTVHAEEATFNQENTTVQVPGAVSFEKGRMSGSGVGMTYNQGTDVLSLEQETRVTVVDESGRPVTEFSAGTGLLSRQENFLALEGSVHALRGEQVLEADRGVARLSENEEFITFIELRGNARVIGGSAFDGMQARDIDLDYTDDGATLERATLTGDGAITLSGGEGAGRRFAADSLALAFGADASLTSVTGRGDVRVDLPGGRGAPTRSVRAGALDAVGEEGRGLTAAKFTGRVEYREDAGNRPMRSAESAGLQIEFTDDAVSRALFTGGVRFDEDELEATAAAAEYVPAESLLRLSGAGPGGGPRVADREIQVEAESMRVALAGPRIVANGNVKTLLRRPPASAPSARSKPGDEGARLPGLLEEDVPVNVNAGSLDYDGQTSKAVYSGGAALWQGETAIRADVISVDREGGDLIAAGNARSSLLLDAVASVGRAAEIRYDDGARLITYAGAITAVPVGATPATPVGATPAAPVGAIPASAVGAPTAEGSVAPIADANVAPTRQARIAPTGPSAVAPGAFVQLSGPPGDLRARRIEVVLASEAARSERLEAYGDVTARIDTRSATGDRLTYHADDERYVLTGVATVPVRIVEECRVTSGRTVTFFKSADRIIVDGREEVRTESSRSGPCPQAAPR